ncbi:hypothetical protein IFT37_01280 [Pseudomonas fluorescens]|uniref:hypothetical protein n=1 Tax=Pseudomonas fluorescens TaxID=294 RepID=UPI00177FB209|nr:hypothetical protein [Pseudomonas fluorescens]MBD8146826.1 hypothetical protein [Pseudomonas fluorescens]MBD8175270.1 hypothetical protein [Pseudomonas fluorescens]MBD8743726.1 hypothetical protein [Pseudomonas fluorescens]MBD8750001.1 hypothetical protein [Pseudomonas fluorescens]MBD8759474.1 hypothetical protein [Pseudomonas fluorescens]
MIVHAGILFLFSTTKGLVAITSGTVSDVQGKGGKIGRLSDDHSIIAILGDQACRSARHGKKQLFRAAMCNQDLRGDVTKLVHAVEAFNFMPIALFKCVAIMQPVQRSAHSSIGIRARPAPHAARYDQLKYRIEKALPSPYL